MLIIKFYILHYIIYTNVFLSEEIIVGGCVHFFRTADMTVTLLLRYTLFQIHTTRGLENRPANSYVLNLFLWRFNAVYGIVKTQHFTLYARTFGNHVGCRLRRENCKSARNNNVFALDFEKTKLSFNIQFVCFFWEWNGEPRSQNRSRENWRPLVCVRR